MSWLNQHPFPVRAYFNWSLVLTYAYPKKVLEEWLPKPLCLDLYKPGWAFVAVAMVQTHALRPKGFPRFFGSDFFLAGYRIFVRYTSKSDRSLRGLYILKSETDRLRMALFGNIFTNYKYTRISVRIEETPDRICVTSPTSGLAVEAFIPSDRAVSLPDESVFEDWRSARRFAGPMPFTFSVEPPNVIVVEGQRESWSPIPVEIANHTVPFLNNISQDEPRLVNAFLTRDIEYSWNRGRRERIER